MIIYPVISGFSTNELTSNFHICDHLIFNFGIRGFCFGFSNTSHVENFYTFGKSVVDKGKFDICIKKRENNYKEEYTKIQNENEFILKMILVDTTTCVYPFILY